MLSHHYDLSPRQWVRVSLPSAVALAGLAGLVLLMAWADLPPRADPIYRVDQILMRHRYDMAQSHHPASVLLIGDSSCAVDVDARALGGRLPGTPRALNLGMMLGLELEVYADVAARFIRNNPGQVRLVVLLLTPEQLSGPEISPPTMELWTSFAQPRPSALAGGWTGLGEEWAGKAILKERVLGHVLRIPLHGAAGSFMGGAQHARDLLHRSDGTHLFLGMFNQSPYAPRMDYELSPALEPRVRRFRAALPRGIKLAAGLTPMPETYLVPEFDKRRLARLQRLNEWLEADYLLTDLPARLPQGLFADPHHLNPSGQQRFTTRLAQELCRLPVFSGGSGR